MTAIELELSIPNTANVVAHVIASEINRRPDAKFKASVGESEYGRFVQVRGAFRLAVRLYICGDTLNWDIAEVKIGHTTIDDEDEILAESICDGLARLPRLHAPRCFEVVHEGLEHLEQWWRVQPRRSFWSSYPPAYTRVCSCPVRDCLGVSRSRAYRERRGFPVLHDSCHILSSVVLSRPGRIRTSDQGIMSPLL